MFDKYGNITDTEFLDKADALRDQSTDLLKSYFDTCSNVELRALGMYIMSKVEWGVSWPIVTKSSIERINDR